MLQPINVGNSQPYGNFDGVDSVASNLKGGEVVGLTYLNLTSSDKKAADVADGYVSNTTKKYPAVTNVLASGMRPLFLADEGDAYYGTLLGSLVGSAVGQDISGQRLGPHTTKGSGKVTVWAADGLYTVTLDAVDLDESTGLQPTNTTIAGADPLYATALGKLTPDVSEAFESVVVARFIEFTTNQSRVTSPLSMVSAPNSPVGSTGKKNTFDRVLIHFRLEE